MRGPYAGARFWALLALVGLGAALRVWKLGGLSLSYDELQSVTHAARPFPLSLLSAFLADPHPPLYYALLGGWMQLGRSDATVLLFSVLLGTALIPSVYHVAARLYGLRVALFAALVCALHPLALFWSHFARMYALVMLLALWAFYWNARLLGERAPNWRLVAALIVTEVCLVYSHVAAPFALLFVYAGVLLERAPDTIALKRWLRLHVPIALLALPYLHFPFTTSQSHMRRPAFPDLIEALSLFVNGVEQPSALVVWICALAFVGVAAALLYRRKHRAFAACLLLAPFLVAAAFSHAIKPIWFAPRIFAFLVPFAALGLARLYCDRGPARIVALVALALLVRGAVGYTFNWEKSQRFVDAAREVRAGARPGDLVLVPTLKDKWAFSWYFAGPDWDRELWTGTAAELYGSFASVDGFRALVRRVGPFGREPVGEPIAVWPADRRAAGSLPAASRIWLVARTEAQRAELTRRFGIEGPPTRFEVAGLDMTLYERSASALAHFRSAP